MSHDFSWVFHPTNTILFHAFPEPERLRFVGGSVRNTVHGHPPMIHNMPPDDIDIATSYTPEQVMHYVKKNTSATVIPTGLKHGTVTVIVNDQPYEITTLRQDIDTDGRHATVQYTSSWIVDAQRRDFTINALYVDHKSTLYDYVGGMDDMRDKVIRFIGHPETRIQEDALRIVRFFRFWAKMNYTPDPHSFDIVCTMKNHIHGLSGERITKEVMQILSYPDPWPVIDVMVNHGFMSLVLGGQPSYHTWSTIAALERHGQWHDPMVRLALVCPTYPKRLVLSNKEKTILSLLRTPLAWHDARQSVYDHGLDITKQRLFLTAMTQNNARDQWTQTLNDIATFSFPPFPVSGQDVKKMGFIGSDIGRALLACRQWWIHHNSTPSRQQCLDYIHQIMA